MASSVTSVPPVGSNPLAWGLLAQAAEAIRHDEFAEYFALKQMLTSRKFNVKDFRRRFATYYQLGIGGLTDKFKDRYFDLLFSCTVIGNPDPYTSILLELYEIPRRKNDYAIQASFVSKLVSIHDDSRPIFDRHVSDFFGIRVPAVGSPQFRVAGFVANLRNIQDQYEAWSSEPQFRQLHDVVRRKQPRIDESHPNRLCDFLVYIVGARLRDRLSKADTRRRRVGGAR